MLGINRIYWYREKKNQAGKADGIFKIDNLVVIYDCTLKDEWREKKKKQIENYAKQVAEEKYVIDEINEEIEIGNSNREVWIITRKHDKEIKPTKEEKGKRIFIKEISINTLVNLYYERLFSEKPFTEEEMAEKLRKIGKGK